MTACHTKSADKLDKTRQSPSDQGIDPLFKNGLADIRAWSGLAEVTKKASISRSFDKARGTKGNRNVSLTRTMN